MSRADDLRARPPGRSDELYQDGAGALVLPVAVGLVVAFVTYLALYAVIVSLALAKADDGRPFTSGSGVVVGIQGALALGVASALGAWLTGRRVSLRHVTRSRARGVALLTGAILAAVVLLLGLSLAVRPLTVPIYVLAVVGGTMLGSALGTGARR